VVYTPAGQQRPIMQICRLKIRPDPDPRRSPAIGPNEKAALCSTFARWSFLHKHEPEDPTQRKLIVGHVGRKLADATSG